MPLDDCKMHLALALKRVRKARDTLDPIEQKSTRDRILVCEKDLIDTVILVDEMRSVELNKRSQTQERKLI